MERIGLTGLLPQMRCDDCRNAPRQATSLFTSTCRSQFLSYGSRVHSLSAWCCSSIYHSLQLGDGRNRSSMCFAGEYHARDWRCRAWRPRPRTRATARGCTPRGRVQEGERHRRVHRIGPRQASAPTVGELGTTTAAVHLRSSADFWPLIQSGTPAGWYGTASYHVPPSLRSVMARRPDIDFAVHQPVHAASGHQRMQRAEPGAEGSSECSCSPPAYWAAHTTEFSRSHGSQPLRRTTSSRSDAGPRPRRLARVGPQHVAHGLERAIRQFIPADLFLPALRKRPR